jgi:hypothetical protein
MAINVYYEVCGSINLGDYLRPWDGASKLFRNVGDDLLTAWRHIPEYLTLNCWSVAIWLKRLSTGCRRLIIWRSLRNAVSVRLSLRQGSSVGVQAVTLRPTNLFLKLNINGSLKVIAKFRFSYILTCSKSIWCHKGIKRTESAYYKPPTECIIKNLFVKISNCPGW